MSLSPQYNYPAGTEITLGSENLLLRSTTAEGYELVNTSTGEVGVTSFSKFASLLKSPVMKVSRSSALSTGILELRLGDLMFADQLAAPQRENGEFHRAICIAAASLRENLRIRSGDNELRLTGKLLDDRKNRIFVCEVAKSVLGKAVYPAKPPGGRNSHWVLYRGRTILKYLEIFDELSADDDVIAALATLDHKKGNRTQRLPIELMELMTEAWEQIGLDLKDPSPSNVLNHLEMLIFEKNKARKRNGLHALAVPSQKTLVAHRAYLQSPTEYTVSVKGEVYGRNKRGRGSTDFRALLVGELVEIDECKISLITSAKMQGYWERLSTHQKENLTAMDEDIKHRLSLLVMIDVASRMPLAWVLSDQPKAEATLALFRMATRDKTREKTVYGCANDPAPAMGLGMIKSDNGVGLRNSKVISSAVGLGALFTTVRTYASPDKPYVESFFGMTESMLIKLIHGYTGRKAGELPGYDSVKNGALDTDELYGILTRFFIDEYPSRKHMGVGMGGRRPAEVLKALNNERGLFRPLDEDQRRIHLGWNFHATPNDEGVRVLSELRYNSEQLQRVVDEIPHTKVSVYLDPDNVNEATAIVSGVSEIFRLQLQVTAFSDLTVAEVLEITEAHLRESPDAAVVYQDRIMSTRRKLYDQLRRIGVENKLPRSYSTFEECEEKARHVFRGVRIEQSNSEHKTVRPGEITSSNGGPGVYPLGADNSPTATLKPSVEVAEAHKMDQVDPEVLPAATASVSKSVQPDTDKKHQPIGRPKRKGSFK
jgi:hypothetical protein